MLPPLPPTIPSFLARSSKKINKKLEYRRLNAWTRRHTQCIPLSWKWYVYSACYVLLQSCHCVVIHSDQKCAQHRDCLHHPNSIRSVLWMAIDWNVENFVLCVGGYKLYLIYKIYWEKMSIIRNQEMGFFFFGVYAIYGMCAEIRIGNEGAQLCVYWARNVYLILWCAVLCVLNAKQQVGLMPHGQALSLKSLVVVYTRYVYTVHILQCLLYWLLKHACHRAYHQRKDNEQRRISS